MRSLSARLFALVAFVFVAPLAFAYDATVTMQATAADATHDASTACHLYRDGTLVGTGTAADKPCGQPVVFANLFSAAGTFVFTSKSVNADGEALKFSPATTVVIRPPKLPADQTSAPNVTVSCTPQPCTPAVIITVSP